jgi:hypothetical protein
LQDLKENLVLLQDLKDPQEGLERKGNRLQDLKDPQEQIVLLQDLKENLVLLQDLKDP